jgi:hypothetical protein
MKVFFEKQSLILESRAKPTGDLASRGTISWHERLICESKMSHRKNFRAMY